MKLAAGEDEEARAVRVLLAAAVLAQIQGAYTVFSTQAAGLR